MNKRYVLKSKRKFYSAVLVLAIAFTTIFFAANVYGYEGTSYKTVTVQKGDTLWELADEYCKSGDIRSFIHEIKKANNLTKSIIYEGDSLKIPV